MRIDGLRRWLAAVAVAATALTGAACTGGADEPREVDVAGEFVRRISDPAFSGHADLTGTMTVTDTTGDIEGSADLTGADSSLAMTIDIAGTRMAIESLTVGGETYERRDGGPWLLASADGGGASSEDDALGAWLTTLESVEDRGVETVEGRRLHHLTPDSPPPLALVGLDEADMSGATVAVDFYADDRGRPAIVVFSVAGELTDAAAPAEMVLRLEFTGPAATFSAPTDVWTRFSSSRFDYVVGHPSTWTAGRFGKLDLIEASGGFPRVLIAPNRIPRGATAEQAPQMFITGLEREFRSRAENVETYRAPAVVGRLATMHARLGGRQMHVLYFTGVHAERVYEVLWLAPAGTEDEDRGAFEHVLGTLEFTA